MFTAFRIRVLRGCGNGDNTTGFGGNPTGMERDTVMWSVGQFVSVTTVHPAKMAYRS